MILRSRSASGVTRFSPAYLAAAHFGTRALDVDRPRNCRTARLQRDLMRRGYGGRLGRLIGSGLPFSSAALHGAKPPVLAVRVPCRPPAVLGGSRRQSAPKRPTPDERRCPRPAAHQHRCIGRGDFRWQRAVRRRAMAPPVPPMPPRPPANGSNMRGRNWSSVERALLARSLLRRTWRHEPSISRPSSVLWTLVVFCTDQPCHRHSWPPRPCRHW